MAGDLIATVAQATTNSTWVDTPVLRSVSDSDAARLSDLLSTQNVQAPAAQAPTSASSVPSVSSVAPVTPANGNSIGDSILRTLDSAGRTYQNNFSKVERTLTNVGGELNAADLLRLQVQLIGSSLQIELISKVVSKGTQHIDQLTKLQ